MRLTTSAVEPLRCRETREEFFFSETCDVFFFSETSEPLRARETFEPTRLNCCDFVGLVEGVCEPVLRWCCDCCFAVVDEVLSGTCWPILVSLLRLLPYEGTRVCCPRVCPTTGVREWDLWRDVLEGGVMEEEAWEVCMACDLRSDEAEALRAPMDGRFGES